MRVLIVKTSSLGDIIHAFPAISYLRQIVPDAKIDWVVEAPFAALLRAHPFVDRVLEIESAKWKRGRSLSTLFSFLKELRRFRYDLLFDFQGNMKSSFATGFARSAAKVGFGRKTVSEWPNLFFTNRRFDPPLEVNVREENLHLVRSIFSYQVPFKEETIRLQISEEEEGLLETLLRNSLLAGCKKVLVCPGSAWRNKRMRPEALAVFLARIGKEQPSFFFLSWGSQEEKRAAEKVQNLLGNGAAMVLQKISLPLLQNFMDRMDLVIAMDSLPLHLAGTTSAKLFGVFGPSSGKKFCPTGDKRAFYQGNCPYGVAFTRRCSALRSCKTGACIRALSGDELPELFTLL